jgi:hypothetical protein
VQTGDIDFVLSVDRQFVDDPAGIRVSLHSSSAGQNAVKVSPMRVIVAMREMYRPR